VIYEGYLQFLRYDSIKIALEQAMGMLPAKATFGLAGNDMSMIRVIRGKEQLRIGVPEQILSALNPNKFTRDLIEKRIRSKETYKDLFDREFLEEVITNLDERILNIAPQSFAVEISKDLFVIGRDDVTAPQILKADRYTGLTSLETIYTTRQLTMKVSKEAMLLTLIGLMSSYVIRVNIDRNQYFYFLFFAPDETLELILKGDKELIERFFSIKEVAKEDLREMLARTTVNELLILELSLTTKIQEALRNENIDKLSLILTKVAREGQTYKIYEQIPLTFYREPVYVKFIEKHFRNPDEAIKILTSITSPQKIYLQAISTLTKKNKYREADNALRALQNLYRFVILGDINGFYNFLAETKNCVEKLKNSTNPKDRKRAEQYTIYLRWLNKAL